MSRQPKGPTSAPGEKKVRYLVGPVTTVFYATLTGVWRIMRPEAAGRM